MSEHYAEITEQEVAQYCNLSYHHFSRLFKKETGQSFKEYLVGLKISEAEKMLLTTQKSITEISQATGFTTSSYFSATFKRKHGITPTVFRRKNF